MSMWGWHARMSKQEARDRRSAFGLTPCKVCEYMFRIYNGERGMRCTRCSGENTALRERFGVA